MKGIVVSVHAARLAWECARDEARKAFEKLQRAETIYLASHEATKARPSHRYAPRQDPYAVPRN